MQVQLTKGYIYVVDRLLQESNAADDTELTYNSTDQVWGNPISEYGSGDTLYHTFDVLGSTDQLIEDGGTLVPYAYRSFGQQIDAATPDTNFTFVGQQNYYNDSEPDLFLTGLRYYSPDMGRFTSNDPIGFDAGDANTYRYCGNNPVNKTDPTGEDTSIDITSMNSNGGISTSYTGGWENNQGFWPPSGPLSAAGTPGPRAAQPPPINPLDDRQWLQWYKDKQQIYVKAIKDAPISPTPGYPAVDASAFLRFSLAVTFNGKVPSYDQFWIAVRWVQSLFPEDSLNALNGMRFVSTLRQTLRRIAPKLDLDNDLLASVDHYFYVRWLVEKKLTYDAGTEFPYVPLPPVMALAGIHFYDWLKRIARNAVPGAVGPPSKPSDLQLRAAEWGVWDALTGETGGKKPAWYYIWLDWLPL